MIQPKEADADIDVVSRWKVGAVAAVSGVVMCAGFWAMQQSAHVPMIDLAARMEATRTLASVEAVSGRSMADVAARALGSQRLDSSAPSEPQASGAEAPEIASHALATWRFQRESAMQGAEFHKESQTMARVKPREI